MRQLHKGRRLALLTVLGALVLPAHAWGQATPTVVDPNLAVRTVATGLSQPTGLAFIGTNDMLVNEKATGRVMRVRNGVVEGPVLDLAVNSASERGLLGIALHRNFMVNGLVYLFWSESNTGADSNSLATVDLLANRLDRFVWNGSTLTFDRNLIRFRAFQADAGQPLRGNHDGGVVRFGPDGKVYVIVGDTGRRGQMQNLEFGPFGPGIPDDQFGGPEPDDAHFTGVIVRLNDDGTTPTDNPFYDVGAEIGGAAGANIQKIYAYGIRNSFGMNFDPISGDLWQNENGDDTFSELNRVEPGWNSGWVQIMGPSSRVPQFKQIETSAQFFGLQQIRWPPTNIADTPAEALSRLFMLPARTSPIPSSRGSSRSPRRGSASSRAARSGRSTTATSSWAALATSSSAVTCSGWRSPGTGRTSESTTRVSRTGSPTTSASSRPQRARASCGVRTSASRPTSCRAPTGTCSSSRIRTAPSTRSSARSKARK
jgi:aldose sugar dehydrogenase